MNELKIKEDIKIETMIYEIRGKQVMFTSDVAKLYEVDTKVLNQTIKRNINRFPENFCFQLTMEEMKILPLRSQIVTLNKSNNKRGFNLKYHPYVLTEQGIMMLSGLLKSDIAVDINVKIIDAFVKMRKFISNELLNTNIINSKLLEHDNRISLLEEIFSKFKENNNEIYFEGQIYEAYSKVIDIIKKAKNQLIIIDAYADKLVLDIISKIKCNVILICKTKSLLNQIDIDKYNKQYHNLKIVYNDTFHDRYFLLDKKILYHCGTSLNHIGEKTFSINKIEDEVIINKLIKEIKKTIPSL